MLQSVFLKMNMHQRFSFVSCQLLVPLAGIGADS